MVCDRCQLKQSKVICPDVVSKPIYKQKEESKDEVNFKEISVTSLDKTDREKSGLNTQLSKSGAERGFNPTVLKCKICKVNQILKGHHYC